MNLLMDWTTVGPYRNLSWLTIVFTIVVICMLVLTIIDVYDSWKEYNAVKNARTNGPVQVLSISNILRSIGHLGVQFSLLITATLSVIISIKVSQTGLYWYRIAFILSFLVMEAILCFIIINNLIARHKLTTLLVKENHGSTGPKI